MFPPEKVLETKTTVQEHLPENFVPQVGLVLGTGLGGLVEHFVDPIRIPYTILPNFPHSTVAGHAGQLVAGTLGETQAIAMQGRFHLYEGYRADQISFPIQLFHSLGARTLLSSNAAGGINKKFNPGDLMIIEDHINLLGANPLSGPHLEGEPSRFLDLSEPYDKALRNIVLEQAKMLGINLWEGVYAALPGPSYETAAEIRYLKTIGADAIGMSIILETIMARYLEMRVVGISCITNMGSGIADVSHDHHNIINNAKKVEDNFITLVKTILPRLVEQQERKLQLKIVE